MTTLALPELKSTLSPEVESLFQRAPDLEQKLRKLMTPDVHVTIDPLQTDCLQVSFFLTWVPSLPDMLQPREHLVDVLVWDDCGTVPALTTCTIFPTDNHVRGCVELPLPPSGKVERDFKRTFYVAADPFGKIRERRDGHNVASAVGTC